MIRVTKQAWFRGLETSKKKKKEKVQAREFHSFMILLVLYIRCLFILFLANRFLNILCTRNIYRIKLVRLVPCIPTASTKEDSQCQNHPQIQSLRYEGFDTLLLGFSSFCTTIACSTCSACCTSVNASCFPPLSVYTKQPLGLKIKKDLVMCLWFETSSKSLV